MVYIKKRTWSYWALPATANLPYERGFEWPKKKIKCALRERQDVSPGVNLRQSAQVDFEEFEISFIFNLKSEKDIDHKARV